ncbi:glycosyltransferase family 2 protein [Caballeronia sp. LjRoot31]|jgi:glycosyltransferase involved in cell wall biosynthesis|uniref:glycosyltransferase family 2 protein n=1 Tax=Caballeronia sp. LjRoot31 TaxID=3342324 RepID=UPI003ED05AE3
MNAYTTDSVQAQAAPVVSVVVLCYNQEEYIGECLQSVLDQELDVPFEVIVGDDNSTDNSLEVIESFRTRYPAVLKVVSHEQNCGFSGNLADSLAIATGEYIANIDGDDIMLPGKLKRQLEFLKTHPEYGLVAHKMRTVDASTKTPVKFQLPRRKPAVFDAEYLIVNGPFFFHSSEMYRAHLRRRNPVNRALKAVSDVAHLLHVLYGSRAFYLDEEFGLYRVNPTGATANVISNPRRRKQYVDDLISTCQIAEDLGMARSVVNRGRANAYLSSAIFYLEHRYSEEFVHCIEASTRARLLSAKQVGLYLVRHWPRVVRPVYSEVRSLLGFLRTRA